MRRSEVFPYTPGRQTPRFLFSQGAAGRPGPFGEVPMGQRDEKAARRVDLLRIGRCPCGKKFRLFLDRTALGQLEIRWCACGRTLTFRPHPCTGADLLRTIEPGEAGP